MNLIDVTKQFKGDDDCLANMENRCAWPDGKYSAAQSAAATR